MTHVLITGCNRGIGRALVQAALARDWQVTGTSRRPVKIAGVDVLKCEMAETDQIARVFANLAPLDVLINNAGIFGPDASTLAMDYAGFAQTIAVNTLGPLAVTEACLPALRKRPGSRVMSVSSQMSYMGLRTSGRMAYRASKVALNKVMQGVATDLEPEGICSVLIDPGWVRTDMGTAAADEDPEVVSEGILDIAARLTLADTGKFFRFDGQERDF